MSLPGTIVLRPNEFTQPDYSVIYKDPDGRERTVGRYTYSLLACVDDENDAFYGARITYTYNNAGA